MNVFAFDGDFAMGVLCSRIHIEWARAQSSTLRVDIRYTPQSAFGTFPWPGGDREPVGDIVGWPRTIAQDADETNRRLLELNRAIAAGEIEYHPFD